MKNVCKQVINEMFNNYVRQNYVKLFIKNNEKAEKIQTFMKNE